MEASGLNELPELSAQEVADALGLSYWAVRRAAMSGEVRCFKICGRLRFRKEDVRAWIARCQVEVEEERSRTRLSEPRPPESQAQTEAGSKDSLRALERKHLRGE